MLSITGRRVLLSIHILLNAILIGGFTAILYLNYSKQFATSSDPLYPIDFTMFKLHDDVLGYVAFSVVVTGLLFSLFTKWGFFDFYWITVKWLSLGVLFFLILGYLGPAINGMAAISDVERLQALNNPLYLKYERDTTIFSVLLLVILISMVVISVFKPWGKRKRPFRFNRKTVVFTGSVFGTLVLATALLQFMQLQTYRRTPINNIDPANFADGKYLGEADYGFQYRLEVDIKDGKIDHITILENRDSFYANLAEGVIKKVKGAQNPNVEAVTGATTTSKCLLKAIENALAKGPIEDLMERP